MVLSFLNKMINLIGKLASIKARVDTLELEAEELKPEVLDHFNKYIDEVINPRFKGDFSMPHSDNCIYDGGKFIVYTSPYLVMPDGKNFRGPVERDGELVDLIIDYEEKAPWLSSVRIEFSLSQ